MWHIDINQQLTIQLIQSYDLLGLSVSSLGMLKIPQLDGGNTDFRHSTNTTCNNALDSIPFVRQRRASSVETPVLHQNGGNATNVKTRRKSLPVLGHTPSKVSSFLLSIMYKIKEYLPFLVHLVFPNHGNPWAS